MVLRRRRNGIPCYIHPPPFFPLSLSCPAEISAFASEKEGTRGKGEETLVSLPEERGEERLGGKEVASATSFLFPFFQVKRSLHISVYEVSVGNHVSKTKHRQSDNEKRTRHFVCAQATRKTSDLHWRTINMSSQHLLRRSCTAQISYIFTNHDALLVPHSIEQFLQYASALLLVSACTIRKYHRFHAIHPELLRP